MYNRYIPKDTAFLPTDGPEEGGHLGRENREYQPSRTTGGRGPSQTQHTPPKSGAGGTAGLASLLSGKEGVLSLLTRQSGGKSLTSALKTLKLGDWDSGDLLLLLIVLLLLTEGDDLELVIALGLALMMGLGEEKEPSSSSP